MTICRGHTYIHVESLRRSATSELKCTKYSPQADFTTLQHGCNPLLMIFERKVFGLQRVAFYKIMHNTLCFSKSSHQAFQGQIESVLEYRLQDLGHRGVAIGTLYHRSNYFHSPKINGWVSEYCK